VRSGLGLAVGFARRLDRLQQSGALDRVDGSRHESEDSEQRCGQQQKEVVADTAAGFPARVVSGGRLRVVAVRSGDGELVFETVDRPVVTADIEGAINHGRAARDRLAGVELPERVAGPGVEAEDAVALAADVDDATVGRIRRAVAGVSADGDGRRGGYLATGVERPQLVAVFGVECVETVVPAADVDGRTRHRRRGDDGPSRVERPQLLAVPGVERVDQAVLTAGVDDPVDDGRRPGYPVAGRDLPLFLAVPGVEGVHAPVVAPDVDGPVDDGG